MRRHPALALTVPTLIALLLSLLSPVAASADPGSDAAFVSRTNGARSASGLPAFAVAGDLTSIARQHAARMAASGTIYHNPSLQSQVCCWTDLGENVGSGSTVDGIHQAFMASPEHRANILSARYTQIGVGTARSSNGVLYVDEVFRRPTGATAAPPPAAPRPAAAPMAGHVTRQVAVTGAQHASRSAVRVPRVTVPTSHDLLLGRVHTVWLAKVERHYERFDPLRRSLDYYAVMRQLTRRPA